MAQPHRSKSAAPTLEFVLARVQGGGSLDNREARLLVAEVEHLRNWVSDLKGYDPFKGEDGFEDFDKEEQ